MDLMAGATTEAEGDRKEEDAIRDVNEAMPALSAALAALDTLCRADISELKYFSKPPQLVVTTMEAVCVLLGKKADWETAKKLLGEMDFIEQLKSFDRDSIDAKRLKALAKYTSMPEFVPECVSKVSKAATGLCLWCLAIEAYARLAKGLEPRRGKLAEPNGQLEKAAAATRTLRGGSHEGGEVSAHAVQEAVAAAERRAKELEVKTAADAASSSNLEERLKAIAIQRQKLIEGMKEKLPDGYHPLSFEVQGERGLVADTVALEKKGADSHTLTDVASVDKLLTPRFATDKLQLGCGGAAQLAYHKGKFLPEARRNRMKGVDEMIASAPSSLRAQAGGSGLTAAKPRTASGPSPSVARRSASMPPGGLAGKTSPGGTAPPKSASTANSIVSPRPQSASPPTAAVVVAKVAPADRMGPRSANACAKPSSAPLNTRRVTPSRASERSRGSMAASPDQSGGPKAAKVVAVAKQTRSLRQRAGSPKAVAPSLRDSQGETTVTEAPAAIVEVPQVLPANEAVPS